VEADFTKLRERIDAAELAIQERVQELREDGNDREERQALQDALAGLKILRRDLAQ
jgi:biotin operon repressor